MSEWKYNLEIPHNKKYLDRGDYTIEIDLKCEGVYLPVIIFKDKPNIQYAMKKPCGSGIGGNSLSIVEQEVKYNENYCVDRVRGFI